MTDVDELIKKERQKSKELDKLEELERLRMKNKDKMEEKTIFGKLKKRILKEVK